VFDLLWSISVLSEFQCLSNPCTRINPSTGTKEPSKRANHKENIKFLNPPPVARSISKKERGRSQDLLKGGLT
jgi:hypothetical protein